MTIIEGGTIAPNTFERGDTLSDYPTPLATTPGEEIWNDPDWADKVLRALEQSDRGESRPWHEVRDEL